jgi:hypothetical protein
MPEQGADLEILEIEAAAGMGLVSGHEGPLRRIPPL